MMEYLDLIKTGGPVTIVVGIFIWYLYQDKKIQQKIQAGNNAALDRNSKVLNQNTKMLGKLSTLMEITLKKTKLLDA